ncbi:MAG: phytanoyl-CoA dioxygenase family protein [Candidatus Handelsmanbacteria bacterium]|nr:phytanoyl-CoA dioxygenase family protein [Candidatus Handelsmanbacteria bacterium]
MNTLEQSIAEIKVYGFTVLEGVLEAAQATALREALIRCAQEHGTEHKHRGPARHVANLPTLDPLFLNLIDHPKVMPLLEHFLGKTLILGSLNARIVRPGDTEQGFHSDIPAEMLNMDLPVMMNTVWMLDDFSARNGGTRVVPGTHRSGLAAPPEGLEVKYFHQATGPAGSVLVFNGQCWHAGGANTGTADRHALFGHYRKRMLVFQFDPHDRFPPEWVERLSPRQREILRMHKGLGAPHAAEVHF